MLISSFILLIRITNKIRRRTIDKNEENIFQYTNDTKNISLEFWNIAGHHFLYKIIDFTEPTGLLWLRKLVTVLAEEKKIMIDKGSLQ